MRGLSLTALVLVSACEQAPLTPPSAQLNAAISEALKGGFRLEDQRGKVASLTPTTPQAHWLLRQLEGVNPTSIWSVSLSNDGWSNVVDIEEWAFQSEPEALAALQAFQQKKDHFREFKMLYQIWSEGTRVYFVSTRAFQFEPELKRVVSLLKSPEKI